MNPGALSPDQTRLLQSLWLGCKAYAWRQYEPLREVWETYALVADVKPYIVRDVLPLIEGKLVKGKPDYQLQPIELSLTDAGAVAIGKDVEGVRQIK